MKLLFTILIVSSFGIPFNSFSQKIKFKTPTKKEMSIKECDFYPEAKAIILDKKGEIFFNFSSNDGIKYQYNEGMRMLILDEDAKNEASFKIYYYCPDNNNKLQDKISNVTGTTYNLENGNITKTKLDKSHIFYNRISENTMELSFAMPNVQKGSLIEYSFTKESGLITTLEPWYFQLDYPVLNNELTTIVPEFFEFQERVTGNLYKVDRNEKWTSSTIGNLDIRSKTVSYKGQNIPPVEEEPFVGNLCDLPMRINFQLISVLFPNSPLQKIAGTYVDLNKRLLERNEFWRAATRGNFPKEMMTEAEGFQGLEKATFLFNWIKRNIAWNGKYGLTRERSLRECLNEKSGKVSEINLSLNALFRENGFEAYPVILSTRGNGVVHPIYPNVNDFNYVISALIFEDKIYLCDATSNTQLGLLPVRCLNYSGYMITEKGGKTIDLNGNAKNAVNLMCKYSFEGNKLIADFSTRESEYAALSTLDKYYDAGEEKYLEDLKTKFIDWDFLEYALKEENGNVIENFKIAKEENTTDIIYMQPFLYGLPREPLFKRDTRNSIVDFPYGIKLRSTIVINLPDGYDVEELPQNVNMVMKDKAGTFVFLSYQNDRSVTFSINFILDKTLFPPQEYPELKAFFDYVTEIANMTIVLKKQL